MVRVLLALLPLCLAPVVAGAQVPEWSSVADVQTIQVITEKEDGMKLDTTVWLVVVDEQGYIRTGSTRWGANVQRNPEVEIRIDDAGHAVLVHFVENDGLRQQITDAFREKYGFVDRLIGPFRRGRPLIMRINSR